MTALGRRLRERMLFQWGVAYLAGAWLLLQVLDLLGGTFSWPQMVQQIATVLLGVGFLAALVLAWYHGERGQQRVAAMELAIFAVLCVIAAVGVALVGGGTRERPSTPPQGEAAAPAPAERRSIAVLPFVNMSGSHENEYFSDGITEEILNALARVPGLKVAGRTSSFAFKGKNEDLSLIGQKLRVAALLEGSVQRAGNRVRITAQLIDASTGYHLWSGRFDRELKDIFALEDEIARTSKWTPDHERFKAITVPLAWMESGQFPPNHETGELLRTWQPTMTGLDISTDHHFFPVTASAETAGVVDHWIRSQGTRVM